MPPPKQQNKTAGMDIANFASEICKTGFVLENKIATALKREGWSVISNKYYEDDHEGSVREIDLVAYKVTKVQNFDVYTTLLISCKKSEPNVWALLARDINVKDPNTDWWPLHTWTNEKSLAHELSQSNRSRVYHKELKSLGVTSALSIPEVDVFAFQEMKRDGGAPQNDKNIFGAITSLMKAQAYEISALPQRKKDSAVYQFNLISVIDSDLIRLKFEGDKIEPKSIESEHYIARYIIKKKESCSRIRFVKASYFENALADYNRLHAANCVSFNKANNNFFEKALTSPSRTKVLLEEFQSTLKWTFQNRLRRKFNKLYDIKSLTLDWEKRENTLLVILPEEPKVLEFLNEDADSKKDVAHALNLIYRYSGEFRFDDGIPF